MRPVENGPMFMVMKVQFINIDIEIDMSTYISVISHRDKNRLLPNVPICKTVRSLNGYDDFKLTPLGILKNIEVKYRNLTQSLDLVIVQENGPVLIGRHGLNAFGLWPLDVAKEKKDHRWQCL